MASSSSAGPRFPSTLAPAAYYEGLPDRIKHDLLPVVSRYLAAPATHHVLELSAGTGLHALIYARHHPHLIIQPTECDDYNCKRIDQTCQSALDMAGPGGEGVRGHVKRAIRLDVVEREGWEDLQYSLEEGKSGKATEGNEASEVFDLVLGSNFFHMIPFPDGPRAIFVNLLHFNLVSRIHGQLLIYGPFKSDHGFFSAADEDFDKAISSRPSPWPLGLRSIDALARIANELGWTLKERIEMPKGNWVLVFEVKNAGTARTGAEVPQ
ncbi:hypothetical protein JCM21900_006462 [Sporobolomyces salmonicolor]